MKATLTHWVPIVTRCPESILPDFIFVELETAEFIELYAFRKTIRCLLSWKRIYMEDAAQAVLNKFPRANCVRVRLMFNKHIVEVRECTK